MKRCKTFVIFIMASVLYQLSEDEIYHALYLKIQSYRVVNIYNNRTVDAVYEILTFCAEIRTEHINAQCGKVFLISEHVVFVVTAGH